MYRTIIELNYSQLPEEGLFGVLEVTFIEWRFNPFLNGLATKDSCDPVVAILLEETFLAPHPKGFEEVLADQGLFDISEPSSICNIVFPDDELIDPLLGDGIVDLLRESSLTELSKDFILSLRVSVSLV